MRKVRAVAGKSKGGGAVRAALGGKVLGGVRNEARMVELAAGLSWVYFDVHFQLKGGQIGRERFMSSK